uniref:Ankyrin repeat domain-containing protein n=1 Tax=Phaeomonas parva TaxID=124430 RepID=A0A7S1XXM2_9STRA|mmetsp:Transcript_46796/g.146065  ORF Transcript_46796/g.146065 Transcript_46796/m.146065 type:complete len:179 (+) Transcript_46796:79-615(+)|eukprot:CAMPEP_0118876066 /NCGR_PEP_ID=MMETSP1163-20130328/16909_1 /TAXON_ID=124430 /ORGANISM="Phaeomonas parva, Strain CCMP2877" /LENGTH=178 /DNA_ID=CAMNT_0006811641 /DNA_START=79 /DNA_END=615 /DNA_ORIENTATION=-
MRAPPPLLLLLALPLAAAQMAVNDVPDERLKYLTELHRAAVEGDEALARAALAADPLSINFAGADHHWVSPLYAAAEHGNVSVLRLLLEAGADASQETADGSTPLLAAANFEEEEVAMAMARLLLAAGADPAHRNQQRYNAKKVAAERGHTQLYRLLREAAPGVVDGAARRNRNPKEL